MDMPSFSLLLGYAYFVCAAAVLFVVIGLAELTCRYIEITGIKLGRKLIGIKLGIATAV
jgi:peptidoglycan/LPS O-acetylase OafA/YrhL